MANVDLGRYRRFVQMFWDPEPTNDINHDQPVWCLGRSYKLSDSTEIRTKSRNDGAHTPASKSKPEPQGSTGRIAPPVNAPDTPPESASSSFSSSLAYEEPSQDNGWPPGFILDFESKFWMTYRSDFESIPRSSDSKATSSLSLSMRIKTQLSDQGGLSSDSGWGCMIRSGQSLLANAMATIRLGRGRQKSS